MAEQYQVYVLETGVTEETEIRAVGRPENGAIARHALIGYTESNVDFGGRGPGCADAEDASFGDYGVPVRIFCSADGHPALSLRFSFHHWEENPVPADGSAADALRAPPRWKSPI